MSTPQSPQKIKIYYDGLCILCSREMEHYKKIKGSENLEFIDITEPQFNAQAEGLDPFAIHRIMHIRMPDGKILTRISAFLEIWKILPQYQWLPPIAGSIFIKPILEIGYTIFARSRPYLPKRKKLCEGSPYCETKHK